MENGVQTPSDRKRKANWVKPATFCLLKLLEENKSMFDTTVLPGTRKKVWDKITQDINATFPETKRERIEIEKKWWGLRKEGKEEILRYKNALAGTGDGSPPKPLSEVALAVGSILGLVSTSPAEIVKCELDSSVLEFDSEHEKLIDNDRDEVKPTAAPDRLGEVMSHPCLGEVKSHPFDIATEGVTAATLPLAVQEYESRKRRLELAVLEAKESMLKAKRIAHEKRQNINPS